MATAQPYDLPKGLVERLEQVIAILGFNESGGVVRHWSSFKSMTNRHIVRQAFENIHAYAVFGFPSGRASALKFAPVLYLTGAVDEAAATAQHRLVWSQGTVPILLVATPQGLQIRRSLTPSTGQPVLVPWDRVDDRLALPSELISLTAAALSSSVVWRDFVADRSNRVDEALLRAIKELNEAVQRQQTTLLDEPALVNALIGRFIYFFVLLDRKIVGKKWIASLKDENGKPLCPLMAETIDDQGNVDVSDRVWPAREVWSLFDRIDGILNGAIFPISASKRRLISTETMHLVRRAIRHGDSVNTSGRQLGFLDVSFATLRTETISAIYELFLLIENAEEKDDDGAFYTPPFLADYVLDEIDRMRSFTHTSRIVDPAAGSGIFLVGAYRRILEREMPLRRWRAPQFKKARAILEKCIFGIEKNKQAANVARFSLYLTLLDYVENASIKELKKLSGRTRVFPELGTNIVDRDLFSLAEAELVRLGRFTHAVGNPPWGTFGAQTGRANVQRSSVADAQRNASLKHARNYADSLDANERPVTNKRLSELFVWKVQSDLLKKDGVFGLLISTRSYVAPSADVFPAALARQVKLVGLSNLSHFRYRLFKKARSPTLAIFAENTEPHQLDKVWVYSPLLTSQPIGEAGHPWSIIVSEGDVEPYKLRDLCRSSESWFWALMLRPIDRRYANHLRLWTKRFEKSFGQFIERSKLIMTRGGSTSQTGVPTSFLLNSTNYEAGLGIGGFNITDYPFEEFRRIKPKGSFAKVFGGNIVFIPRHMNQVLYVQEPIGFVSTFNALYAQDPSSLNAEAIDALKGIARFLTSDVARYLYALFGKTRILDSARLEKGDLGSIPFPFEGLSDSKLRELKHWDDAKITKFFTERVGLDSSFIRTVTEYHLFREGYEDSQVPNAALAPPNKEAVAQYELMFAERLAEHFGGPTNVVHSVQQPAAGDYVAIVKVHIGASRSQDEVAKAQDFFAREKPTTGFNPYARIVFDAISSSVAITKPWTRVAWTVEQAYADARGVSEEVVRSGVPS